MSSTLSHQLSRPLTAERLLAAESRPATELRGLVCAARAGDDDAWSALVRRCEPKLRAIARSYRLDAADVDDVIQATWLSLFEHIRALRDPAAIAGWLATTTRRAALRVLQTHVREHLTGAPHLGEGPAEDGPEDAVLAAERRAALLDALDRLPDRHRELMTALATQPALDYDQVSARLTIPRGSIGPIRAKSLRRLARDPRLAALAR